MLSVYCCGGWFYEPSSRDICVERTILTACFVSDAEKQRSRSSAASWAFEGDGRRLVCSTCPYLWMEGGVGCHLGNPQERTRAILVNDLKTSRGGVAGAGWMSRN